MTHIKISVIFCYDKLRLGFILTVNHIHVESSLLEQRKEQITGGSLKSNTLILVMGGVRTCLMKSSGRCSWSSRHFSSSPTKNLKCWGGDVRNNLCPRGAGRIVNPLSVPVVDLVDVPKDDLVLSLHVVRNAFFLDPLHEALQDHKGSTGQISKDTMYVQFVITYIVLLFSIHIFIFFLSLTKAH